VGAAAGRDDLVEHRQEGGETGAAGQHQNRPLDLAQIEAAKRTGHAHAGSDLGLLAQEAAHQAARDIANQEGNAAVLRHGTEGVGAVQGAAGNVEVGVLAGQEGELLQGRALQGQ